MEKETIKITRYLIAEEVWFGGFVLINKNYFLIFKII